MAITTFVREAARLTIGGGAVYFTLQQGFWSSTQQGSRALEDVRTSVLPATDKYIQQVPSLEQSGQKAINYWNTGVQKACSGLASSPETVTSYTKQAVEKIKESIK